MRKAYTNRRFRINFHEYRLANISKRVYTVEPRYVELGYLELPAISNRIGLPLDMPVFSVIYYGLPRTRLSRTPRYLELSLSLL